MTPKTKAAIEQAAKLPTAEEFFIVHAPSKNIPPDFYVNEIVELMESHTAAHTAALRERVKELEVKLELAESDEPFWKSELGLSEARIKELNNRVEELESLMQEFVDRVDQGEVRSKRTYTKFKEALK